MQPIYIREDVVRLSDCAADGRLSLNAVFDIFMDVATLHAAALGIGFDDLAPRHLFWLAVRTKIKVYRRPAMGEAIRVVTWPEKGGKLRSNRSYRLFDPRGAAVEGKTEWAVINTASGRLTPLSETYPEGLMDSLSSDTVWSEPAARVREDFSDGEDWAAYTVRSTDIDVGGHMNNAAYARMLLGAFSHEELRTLDVHEMELSYRRPCFEGDTLRIRRRKTEGGWEIGVFAPDGQTVLLGKLG